MVPAKIAPPRSLRDGWDTAKKYRASPTDA